MYEYNLHEVTLHIDLQKYIEEVFDFIRKDIKILKLRNFLFLVKMTKANNFITVDKCTVE